MSAPEITKTDKKLIEHDKQLDLTIEKHRYVFSRFSTSTFKNISVCLPRAPEPEALSSTMGCSAIIMIELRWSGLRDFVFVLLLVIEII